MTGASIMQHLITIAFWNLAAVLSMMVIGWLISLRYRNVSIVDSLWGLGFVLVAWITFFLADGFIGRKMLIAVLATLWGMRLSIYLGKRNWGAGEDRRYGQWRKKSGQRFWYVSLFKVFLLQAVFLWVVSLVLQYGQFAPVPDRFCWLDVVGVFVWAVGFFFEAVGDYQLRQFKKRPENKGKIITTGLWKYTRHPNYFGEVVLWWGIFLLALSIENGWIAVLSPLLISFLLLRVSGVTMLEKKYAGNLDFEAYAKRTNAFFPWFSKKI